MIRYVMYRLTKKQKVGSKTHHVVTFIFDGENQFSKLFQTIGNDLLIVRLISSNALEVKLV